MRVKEPRCAHCLDFVIKRLCQLNQARYLHYNDVIMSAMTSQITISTIVIYSNRRSNKTSKLRVTGLCAGNSPGTGEFPAQRASNVSIWWRHHVSWCFPDAHVFITIHCTHSIIRDNFDNICKHDLIVIAIGDDYRFAFFGLVTKLWLKFQGLFY